MSKTGNIQFYKNVFKVLLPIALQNIITNFVSLLDNIMIGQVGTEQMSGVAIANQLFFVFALCIFGGLAGAGIYTAQFYGKGDNRGICQTVRMKIYIGILTAAVFAVILWSFGGSLINTFLHEGNEGLDLALTFTHGMSYMKIMMIQLLPFAFIQIYASTLREAKETVLPMVASIVAVFVNLIGNYILIFGKFGAPELGVEGAAIATVIARFAEVGILVVYAHVKKAKFPFFAEVYRSFRVAAPIVKGILRKGSLLLVNELLWSSGMTFLNQCYSLRGLEVVSAINISSTISNLFMCGVFACGSTINIMVGQLLGAGELDEAVKTSKRITVLSVLMCIVVGVALALCARPLAGLYNTTDTVKDLASSLMLVVSCVMPLNAFTNACYFTLRSGGKVVITFLFDSVATWCGYVVVAFCLTRFTSLPIIPVYILVNCVEILKCIAGFFMVRSRTWVVNLVADK